VVTDTTSARDLSFRFELLDIRWRWAARAIDYGKTAKADSDIRTFHTVAKRSDARILVTCEEHNSLLAGVVDALTATLHRDVMILANVKTMRAARPHLLVRPNVFIFEDVIAEHAYLREIGVKAAAIHTAIRELGVGDGDNSITVEIPADCLPAEPSIETMLAAIRQLGFR
jgi:hypothetical protein